MTLAELGDVYGVSRERVRQIEVRAFAKLQRAMLTAAAALAGRRPLYRLKQARTGAPAPQRDARASSLCM
jgi:Sigma-70, region 4